MVGVTLNEQDYEWPGEVIEEVPGQELSDQELSAFIASGTLTEEVWQAHQAGVSWQIQVGGRV